MKKVIIGSRESRLAVIQSEMVKKYIEEHSPEIQAEILTMKTTGDIILDRTLDKIGGKGLFVKELDKALMEKRSDLSVHSLKDMPMEENPELPILAYGKREDPRDVLLYRPDLDNLPEHPLIGTSSRRRMIQMEKLVPDCSFRGIRGNVQTRMKKLETEGYDATLLAAAGLKRLGMEHVISRYLSVDEMIPAAGQGILAVQGRKGDNYGWAARIDIPESRAAAQAERQFIRVTGGDCTSPCAAHAQISGSELKLTGLYYKEDSREYSVNTFVTDISEARQAGETLALRMMEQG